MLPMHLFALSQILTWDIFLSGSFAKWIKNFFSGEKFRELEEFPASSLQKLWQKQLLSASLSSDSC